jgi:NADPH-dependent 2,4-dienoyl-CoA reductase/sulfur reductase-like enzyme
MIARRSWLASAAALTALGLGGCASVGSAPARARVLVVGGGFAGATAAHYVRLFSGHAVEVVLVEPKAQFVSCPMSNRVLGGHRAMADITHSYAALSARHGVRVVRDRASALDAARRVVTLASGATIAYDKLILAPGIDVMLDAVEGLAAAHARGLALHAWIAGPETAALRRQIEQMRDGGVYALTVPLLPYRCPPGPYERACLVASYFKAAKPRSKVLILDANPDVTSKPALFKRVWAELYPGIVEHRPNHNVVGVDAATRTLKLEVGDDVRADVLNVVPPQRAGLIAVQAGLATVNARWCAVDFQGFESTQARHVHVLGDAIQGAPLMPKSAHMANAHAKVAAAAVVAQLAGWSLDPAPVVANTCYSFVDAQRAMHVAAVWQFAPAERTFRVVPGTLGVSDTWSEREGVYAWDWARVIWADTLGV